MLTSEEALRLAAEVAGHTHGSEQAGPVECWACSRVADALLRVAKEAEERGRELAVATIQENVMSAREAYERGRREAGGARDPREGERVRIPDDVLDKVNEALNIALSLALLHKPELHPRILEAVTALDDAMEEADD